MRGLTLLVVCIIEAVYVICGGLVFWTLQDYGPGSVSVTNVSVSGSVEAGELIQLFDEFIENQTGCVNRTHLVNVLTRLAKTTTYRNVSDQWSIAGSVFFAMTVVSTIGYGNFIPSTVASRTFCCCYAIIGIPLTLVMLTGIGETLHAFSTRLETKLAAKLPRLGKIASFLVVLCVGVIFFILIPAIIFAELQGWSYGTAIYFEIISLTTIGFGDFVAGFPCPPRTESKVLCELYRVATGIWIYIGLAWLSGFMSSLQGTFGSAIKRVDSLGSIVDKCISKPEVSETEPNQSRDDGQPADDDDDDDRVRGSLVDERFVPLNDVINDGHVTRTEQ